MNFRYFFISILAAALVCVSGCQKSNPDLDEDPTTCPFCLQTFKTEEDCLNHQNDCDVYEHDSMFDEPICVNVPQENGSDVIVDLAHWMSYIPSDTRIADMTIPGLHDAATYSYKTNITPKVVKDQNIDYRDAWKMGARAFDLRMGYDARTFQGEFKDRCKFFHGDVFPGILFGICMMHNFRIDIVDHFPTKKDLEGECMILITKTEFFPASKPCEKIEIFEYLMHLLVGRYGKESFIAYSPDLTIEECRGKVIVFTREKDFTKDYSTVGDKTPSVPVTYISDFPNEGETKLTVYQSGRSQGESKAYVQDKYDVGSKGTPQDKYKAFTAALDNRKAKAPHHLFFNGMNAIQGDASWEVCVTMNSTVGNNLNQMRFGKWLPTYRQQLGIVLTDFYGVTKYKHGKGWDERNFSGEFLAKELVFHNFRNEYSEN